MKYKLYECGGKVRDELLGLQSKDIDYSVVIEESNYINIEDVFKEFSYEIKQEGFDIFLETPDCFTIRAMFPKNHVHAGLVADFVLSRRECGYKKGTRKPYVELGSLKDDLERRDFTINAMALDSDGNIIDLFGGQKDLLNGVLRTPLDTVVSFNDDPLRILRAFRFSVTKGLGFSDEVVNAIATFSPNKMSVVSGERIREELIKMFKFDTLYTLQMLRWLEGVNSGLYLKIFEGDMWLLPTNKVKS